MAQAEVEGPWALPEGWCWATFGAVLPLSYGKALRESDRVPSGNYTVFGSSGRVGVHNSYLAPANSLIVGRKGSAGSIYHSKDPSWPIDTAYFTSGCSAIDVRYGYWFLSFKNLRKLDQSTAIPSLSRDIYREQAIALAPLAEQKRIVARVDALFAEIAEGEAALAEARRGLDTFRRALLKAAVTGELTKDWREKNPVAETGPERLTRLRETFPNVRQMREAWTPKHRLPQLPTGWAWCAIQEAGEVQLGRQRAPQHHDGEDMRPYLRVANVMEDRLDLTDVKLMNFTPAEFLVFALRPGDILLNEGQAPDLLGRPAMYHGEIDGCCFQKTLLRFRSNSFVDPNFALLVFRHYMHSGRFKKESRITTNIGHLTQVRFVVMEFPLPPINEQHEIVARFKALAAQSNEIEAAEADAARLKQSILKAAFEGRLVSQDPSDEPASVALARIKTTDEPKRGRKAAAKKVRL